MDIIRLPEDTPPILSVVIHTEEEFDWNRPYSRAQDGVGHMRHIGRAQALFERFGIVPNYVIGAHLHPWVCPPTRKRSMPALPIRAICRRIWSAGSCGY